MTNCLHENTEWITPGNLMEQNFAFAMFSAHALREGGGYACTVT